MHIDPENKQCLVETFFFNPLFERVCVNIPEGNYHIMGWLVITIRSQTAERLVARYEQAVQNTEQLNTKARDKLREAVSLQRELERWMSAEWFIISDVIT